MATTRTHTVVPSTGDEAEPYSEQIKFLGNDRPYYGFISGSGAGKTFSGVYRLWLNATLWNPNDMGAIIVPDKSQFTDNIKPIMEDFGLMERWGYNSVYTDEPGLVTPNGQRILILSADNERQIGRIKGKNLAYVWMDEEAEINPRAREIADQRLRVGGYPNLFITTTPDGKNHTYEFFKGDVDDAREYEYERATIIENDQKLAVVGVPSEANPVIDDKHIERMRQNLSDQIVAQEIEGQFVEIGSGVLTRDMVSYIDANELPDRQAKWVLGVDIGVQADAAKADQQDSDYWACAILAVDSVRNEGYLMDLQRKRGMTLREGLQWLRGISKKVGNPEVCIESNSAQRFFAQEAKEQGLRVTQVQNTTNKEDRIVQLSIPFENDTVRLVDAKDDRFDEFLNEWIAFPDGTHDDALDAVEIAVSNAPLEGVGNFYGGNFYEDN